MLKLSINVTFFTIMNKFKSDYVTDTCVWSLDWVIKDTAVQHTEGL